MSTISRCYSTVRRRIGRTRRILSRIPAIANGCHYSKVNPNGMMAKSSSSLRGRTQVRDESCMTNHLRLMCVLAHPDDESLGNGGILAKYAAEGIETYLVTATRGERGWFGDERDYPGSEALGKRRQAELLAAASVLGIRQVEFLDYID